LGTTAAVDLECEQFICHIHHVLVPKKISSDVHYLRAFGMLHKAACLRYGFQLCDDVFACWAEMTPSAARRR
jgi:hypothetical protein